MGIRFNARTNSIETDATAVNFSQPIASPASTTSAAGFNIAEGVAPTTPIDGDIWVTAAGDIVARLNGANVSLLGVSPGSVGLSAFDADVAAAFELINGSYLDSPDVSVSSNGTTITLSLEKTGGGDLRIMFSTGVLTYDTTPAATISLTAGTDTSPTLNYVYILESTGVLTVSTSDWPAAEYAPVATVLCQSAASAQTDGVYKLHAWTDHTSDGTNSTGHLAHLNRWIRLQPATWESGVALTPTVGLNTYDVATTSGTVLQLHDQSYPAFNTATGSEVMIVNDNTTAYKRVGDLTAELSDATGTSMSGRDYSLVFWGVVSQDTGDCQLMVNLPTGSYNNASDAQEDPSGYTEYTIPSAFTGTGFLIARITVSHTTTGGGTWTLLQNDDLRGLFPATAPGAGGGSLNESSGNLLYLRLDGTNDPITGPVTFSAATTGGPSINIPEGVAPSAPVDGDVWVTAAGAFNARLNGVTVDLAAGGGGTIGGSITDNQIAVGATTADDIEGSASLTFDGTTVSTSKLNLTGTGIRATASMKIESAQPSIYFQETGATADEGNWDILVDSDAFAVRTASDADGFGENAFIIQRTGTTVTSTTFNGTLAADNLSGTNTGDEPAASDTVAGIVELATIAETNTGTDATRAVTPDGLDGWTGSAQFTTAGALTATSFTDATLGATGILYAGTGGIIENDSGNFVWDGTRLIIGGVMQLVERADHAASPAGGRGEVWVKSGSLGGELMYTEGDQDRDFTAYNVIEATYHFDQTTTAADPGAGNLRWNNATAGSVTNWYIDDLDETGRDNSYMLGNLADGDILTLRNMWSDTGYMVASVNGTPTDNTGYWTIPVTVIHSNARPSTGDPVHINVEWAGSQAGGTIAGSITDNQVAVGATTANSIEGSAGFTFDAASNTLSIYDTTDAERLQISNSLTQAVLNTNAGSSFAFQQGGSNILTLASGTSTFTSGVTLSGAADDLNMPTDGNIIWPLGEIYATSNDFIIGARGSSTGNDFFIQTNRGGTAKDGIIIRNNFAVEVYYNDVLKFQTSDETAADNSSGAEVVDGSGTLRSVGFNLTPHVTNNATNVPFTQAQVGYDIISTNATAYTWTTNASTGLAQTDIPLGSMWKCTNLGAGNITIAGGSGVTLTWFDGSGTTGNRTLGQYGTCTVYKYSNTAYHIWGTGLT